LLISRNRLHDRRRSFINDGLEDPFAGRLLAAEMAAILRNELRRGKNSL